MAVDQSPGTTFQSAFADLLEAPPGLQKMFQGTWLKISEP